MEISGAIALNGEDCACWSPNGRLLAVVSGTAKVAIRDAASLEVLRTEVLVSRGSGDEGASIDKVAFSPDSKFLLASMYRPGLTFCFRTDSDKESTTWRAKISEGAAGMKDVFWSPDSRHIVSLADFNVKLTVWSLVQKKVRYIKAPKSGDCVAFSNDGKYLGVVERRDNKDCVSLFSCSSDWGVASHFELSSELDTVSLTWSPGKSDRMCVFSSKLQCIAYVYTIDGRCLFSYCPDEIGLSMFNCQWSKCGNILAIATSASLALCNTLTWSLVKNMDVPLVLEKDSTAQVYVEEEKAIREDDMDARLARELVTQSSAAHLQYVAYKGPLQLLNGDSRLHRSHSSRKLLRPNVSLVFSNDNNYLLAMPATPELSHICWIYSVRKLTLEAVLVHDSPIVNATWSPSHEAPTSLILITSAGNVYAWTKFGAVRVELPPLDRDYGRVKSLQWNPLGKAMAFGAEAGVVCCRVAKSVKQAAA